MSYEMSKNENIGFGRCYPIARCMLPSSVYLSVCHKLILYQDSTTQNSRHNAVLLYGVVSAILCPRNSRIPMAKISAQFQRNHP